MRCELCGRETTCVRHHVFFGTANRKLSEKYGMVAMLCPDCHTNSGRAVHRNRLYDLKLKQSYQVEFEKRYPDEDFIKVFGRNYRGD